MARNIAITLTLNANGFTAGMTGAASAVQTFNVNVASAQASLANIEKRLTGMVGSVQSVVSILGHLRGAFETVRAVTTGWVESIVQANANMQRMTFLLQGLSTAADSGGKIRQAADDVRYLLDKTSQAPFSLKAMSDSFVKLKAGGLDSTRQAMNALTDAVAAFGGNNDILERASISIQQMGGKGVISMEELRQQLGEAVPNAMKLMADSMGLTVAQLVKKVSTGTVEAKSALSKFVDELDRTYGGRAKAIMETFGGQLAQTQSLWIKFAETVGGLQDNGRFRDGSFMAVLTQQLKDLNAVLGTNEFKSFAVQVGQGLTAIVQTARGLLEVLIQISPVLIGIGKVMLVAFASRAIVGSIQNLSLLLGGAAGQLGTLQRAFRTVGSEMGYIGTIFAQFGARLTTTKTFLTDLSISLRAIGPALATIGGAALILIPVILQVAESFGLFKNKAKEADEALMEFAQGIDTVENLKKFQADIAATREQVNKLKEDIQNGGEDIMSPDGFTTHFAYTPEVLAAKQRELEDAQRRLQTEEQALFDSSTRLAERRIQAAAENAVGILSTYEQTTRDKYNEAKVEFDAAKKAVTEDSALTAAQKTTKIEELTKGWAEKVRDFYSDTVAGAQNVYDQIKKIEDDFLNGRPVDRGQGTVAARILGSETDINKMVGLLKAAERDALKRLDEMKEKASSGVQTFDAPNIELAAKQTGIIHQPFETFDRWADSARESAAEARANLAGLNGEVARFEQMFNDGKFDPKDAKGNVLSFASAEARRANSDMQKLLEAGRKLAQEKQSTQDDTKDAKIYDDLKDGAAKARAESEQLWDALRSGFAEANDGTAKFDAQVDGMVNDLHTLTAEARSNADAMKAANAEARNLKQLLDLQARSRQLGFQLIDNPRERAEEEYRVEVDRVTKEINLNAFSGQKRADAERILSDYISRLRENLDRQNEASAIKLARQWKDLSGNIKDATGDWVSDFVDKLADGKLSFADFAESIIKDIAKMVLEAEIANAILAFTGSGNSSTNGAKTQSIGTTVNYGGTSLSKLHGGGIAGRSGGFGFYDSALFRNAVRYHTGTMGAGLRSNEVATVLEVGETVRTVDQERAVQRALNGEAGGAMPAIQFNVINQSGTALDAKEQGRSWDGRQMIVDVVVDELSRDSNMRKSVKNISKSR